MLLLVLQNQFLHRSDQSESKFCRLKDEKVIVDNSTWKIEDLLQRKSITR